MLIGKQGQDYIYAILGIGYMRIQLLLVGIKQAFSFIVYILIILYQSPDCYLNIHLVLDIRVPIYIYSAVIRGLQ